MPLSNIKLLFITRDFENYTERNTYYLCRELGLICDLMVWHSPGNIMSILAELPSRPDFILINDLKETRSPHITGLRNSTIPLGIFMHDIHYKVDKRREFIRRNRVRHIFSIYRDPFKRRFPEYTTRMHWLPHWVNTDIFKDYDLPRDINWLMMGKMASYYPLRMRMYQTMKNKPGFVCHSHPGYRNINDQEESKIYVGERYAREIARSKMFLTCDSIFHYPIIKYYEVLACNTLLLAPASKELRDLGFIPGVHYVAVNRNNFLARAKYFLKHEQGRLKIAEEGCRMVQNRHTVEIRARQLLDMINEIIEK